VAVPRSRGACAALAALALAACATSPLGRTQLKLFPEGQLAQMGVATFDKMQREMPVSSDAATNAYVRCVARAILDELPPGQTTTSWKVVVFEDRSANAFALPGGRIGVNTGLLDVATNQHQLAAVLGHEVAHVVAGHANERVSQAFATQTGLQAVSIAAGAASPQQRQLIGLLGAGAQIGILLPYSRTHETEADLVGLDLMARAGFDPRQSVALWVQMGKAGRQPPEFLSTHPSSTTRISKLEQRMPSAKRLHDAARAAGKRPHCQ
jgi:predicted Zn-dependent protease